MKVFFDIITNHTADVIDYRGGATTTTSTRPWRPTGTPSGHRSTTKDLRRQGHLPAADPRRRSPTPVLPDRRPTRHGKTPAWLNDPTMYHNRGDSTFAGESSDLWRLLRPRRPLHRAPEVVTGMGDIYKTGSTSASTASASTPSSTSTWSSGSSSSPDILGAGQARSATTTSSCSARSSTAQPEVRRVAVYTTAGKLPATLDFGFQKAAVDFAVSGKATNAARRLLRRRRLVHRRRLQRLSAADLPRQPRHGPGRRCFQARVPSTHRGHCCPGSSSPMP
jgi:hypothetical protein